MSNWKEHSGLDPFIPSVNFRETVPLNTYWDPWLWDRQLSREGGKQRGPQLTTTRAYTSTYPTTHIFFTSGLAHFYFRFRCFLFPVQVLFTTDSGSVYCTSGPRTFSFRFRTFLIPVQITFFLPLINVYFRFRSFKILVQIIFTSGGISVFLRNWHPCEKEEEFRGLFYVQLCIFGISEHVHANFLQDFCGLFGLCYPFLTYHCQENLTFFYST